MHYERTGGYETTQPREAGNRFEEAVERAFGERLRAAWPDRTFGGDVWSGLGCFNWRSADGDTAEYTQRAAGDLLATIVGRGNYMDWFLTAPDNILTDEVREAMAAEGWST